jgi:biopolymer transport protein ExbD
MGRIQDGDANDDEPAVMLDINTTPLIDVMLVLLIMLIITIPVQLHSIALDLPSKPASAPERIPEIIRIDIARDGTIRWQAQVLGGADELQSRMAQAAALAVQPELHLRPDRDVRYASVAAVLAQAQRAGLTRIGVVGSEQFAE